MATAKLAAVRLELEAEGSGWIEISHERDWSVVSACGHVYPQPAEVPQELAEQRQAIEAELDAIAGEYDDRDGDSDHLFERQEAAEARLAEIDAQIEALAAFDPEHVRIAGCYVSIDHDGALRIEKGLVRKQDMKRLTQSGEPREKKPKGLPQTLIRDLEGYRLQVARIAIARNRLIALDLLIFTAASHAFRYAEGSGPDVLFRAHDPKVKEQTAADHSLKGIEEALPLEWLKAKTEAERFQAFTGLAETQKLDLLAWCVLGSLKPQLSTGHEATAFEAALSLTGHDPAGYWRPTAANYLGRITRDQLLTLGRDILGESWAQARHRDKKAELSAQLERAFAEPEKYGRTPEQLEKLAHWLPEGMAFSATAPAKPKAIKKQARKAA